MRSARGVREQDEAFPARGPRKPEIASESCAGAQFAQSPTSRSSPKWASLFSQVSLRARKVKIIGLTTNRCDGNYLPRLLLSPDALLDRQSWMPDAADFHLVSGGKCAGNPAAPAAVPYDPRRLGQSQPTGCDRLPSDRKPSAPAETREKANLAQRRPAVPVSRQLPLLSCPHQC